MPARAPETRPEAALADPPPPEATTKGGDTAAGLLGQLTSFVAQVAKSPAAALLGVGLVLVIVALVRDVGGVHLETTGSQYLTLGIALGLCAVGLVWPVVYGRKIQRRLESLADSQLPAVARDPAFLLKVLVDAMPPAFVKELNRSKPAPDLVWTTALARAQEASSRVSRDETLHRIQLDHLAGDRTADDNGASIQIELPNALVHGKLRPIVTFKRLIEHNGKKYVVGWYVPVEREGLSPDDDHLVLHEEACQVLFRLAPAPGKDGGITVPVGEAIRDALEQEPKRRATRQRRTVSTPRPRKKAITAAKK
jgi:hypothetical protein